MKILEDALLDESYDYIVNLERQYDLAIKEVEDKLAGWYRRFASNNEITLAEARKLLDANELEEFKWTVDEYIKYGRENAISQEWMKQLENASARVHISRLDSIKLQLQQQAEALYGNQLDNIDEIIKNSYSESYYRTAFEIQKGVGVGWSLQGLSDDVVRKVLARPWTLDNQTFSDKLWNNKKALINSVNTELTQMIIRGTSPDKAIKTIAGRFNVSKSQAGRLIMTESAAFANVARKDCFNELGVEQYIIVGTLDRSMCSLCGSLDGQICRMSDYQVGVTAPPFHPWCRCTTAPYFEDMEGIGERFARDVKTGESFSIPKDMKYADWRLQQDAKYGTGTVEKQRKMQYNETADKKQYAKYTEVLGKGTVGSFEDFQTLKYDEYDKWRFVKLDYSRQNKLIQNPKLVLPNVKDAIVDNRKFTEYLFGGHNEGGLAKGRAFTSRLGYDISNYEEMKAEIIESASHYPTTYKNTDKYGNKYEQKIILYGKNNTPANVVIGWKVDKDKTWLTSAYIKEIGR